MTAVSVEPCIIILIHSSQITG